MHIDPYRHRLRPSIDLDALEALLGRITPAEGLIALTLCFQDPRPDDWRTAGLPPPPEAPTPSTPEWRGGERPGSLRFRVEPHYDYQLNFSDPDLQALWVRAQTGRARGA